MGFLNGFERGNGFFAKRKWVRVCEGDDGFEDGKESSVVSMAVVKCE